MSLSLKIWGHKQDDETEPSIKYMGLAGLMLNVPYFWVWSIVRASESSTVFNQSHWNFSCLQPYVIPSWLMNAKLLPSAISIKNTSMHH